jgi:hypothetical protein
MCDSPRMDVEPGLWTRRIVLFVRSCLLLVAGGGATLAILHREAGHNVVAAPVVAKVSVEPTVSQPTPQSEQRQAQPPTSPLNDATVFASVALPRVTSFPRTRVAMRPDHVKRQLLHER